MDCAGVPRIVIYVHDHFMMINHSWLMMTPNDSGLWCAHCQTNLENIAIKKGSNYYRHRHTD